VVRSSPLSISLLLCSRRHPQSILAGLRLTHA